MAAYNRGDMLYALIPNQENPDEYTDRLCIVLDGNRSIYTLAPCTKVTTQASRYKKTIFVAKNSARGLAMNLPYDSIVILDRLDSFDNTAILDEHSGKAPNDLLDEIDDNS